MSLNFGAGTAITTQSTRIGTVPAGVCDVVISNTGSTNVIYLGSASGVTTTSGFPLPAGATITIHGWTRSTGGDIWAIAAGTGNNGAVFISNAA